jgi:hypothetical protein
MLSTGRDRRSIGGRPRRRPRLCSPARRSRRSSSRSGRSGGTAGGRAEVVRGRAFRAGGRGEDAGGACREALALGIAGAIARRAWLDHAVAEGIILDRDGAKARVGAVFSLALDVWPPADAEVPPPSTGVVWGGRAPRLPCSGPRPRAGTGRPISRCSRKERLVGPRRTRPRSDWWSDRCSWPRKG